MPDKIISYLTEKHSEQILNNEKFTFTLPCVLTVQLEIMGNFEQSDNELCSIKELELTLLIKKFCIYVGFVNMPVVSKNFRTHDVSTHVITTYIFTLLNAYMVSTY